MFSRVLVPLALDVEPVDVREALRLVAPPPEPALTVLHVIETVEDTAYEDLASFYETLRGRAETALRPVVEVLAEAGYHVDLQVVLGKRAPEIVRSAAQTSADLVVLASHRVDPEHPARGLWSISHQVAVMAPCSVLLVRS
jgi:nucleotide-binding universal stress UspA family protein